MSKRISAISAASTDAPPLTVVYRPIESLIPYCRNSREHGEESVAAIAASLIEYGWTAPCLLDGESGILAGHGRVLAARRVWDAGRTIANCPPGQIPCIDLAHLSATQKRAYVITDNATAERSQFNDELLRLELHDLHEEGFDLGVIGFEAEQLSSLMYGDVPPPPADDVDISAGSDEGKSGVENLILRYGDTRVQMSAAELSRITALHRRYSAENAVSFGFIDWLCDGRDALDGGGTASEDVAA